MIAFIIRRPVLVAMIIAALCLLGIVAYDRLPVENQPSIELPMLIVVVGGARDSDPSYLERHAVVPLESAIAGLEDIESIESYISRNRTTVFVYYQQSTDVRYAYLKLQQRVKAVQQEMGNSFFFSVWKIDTEQLANRFMTLEARGAGDVDQIRNVIDRKVTAELQNIDGVANVAIYGGRERSVEILLDETAMAAHKLTSAQIRNAIASGNQDRQFLGHVTDGRRKHAVNLGSDLTSVENLGNIVLKEQGPVLLKHVAEVLDGASEETSISRVNGMESVSVSIIRERQANLLELAERTHEQIEKLNEQLKIDGIELIVKEDQAEAISKNIDTIKELALIGSILAIIILWLFLRNFALVLVVAGAIPISVLIALNFFYVYDLTINTLSLFGIAIAIGMLLDNSVVVLESIHRQIGLGKNPYDAVIIGAGEVWRPVMASTMTTVAVFLPFIFTDNFLIQLLGRHIGISIVSTLLVSLGVAFLIIPAFAYRFLSKKSDSSIADMNIIPRSNRMMQIYTLFLKSCLRFPARTSIISVVVLFMSIIICLAVSINSPTEVESEMFNLYATLPSGTTLDVADIQSVKMDERISDIAELKERAAQIEEDQITFSFELLEDYEDIDDRDLSAVKSAIINSLEDGFPRIDFNYEQPLSDSRYQGGGGGGMGGGGGDERAFGRLLGIGVAEEKVIIRGQDIGLLATVADDIQYNIDNMETVRRSRQSIASPRPGIDLVFSKTAVGYFGITPQAIIAELSNFQSEVSSGVSLQDGDEKISVILKNEELEERNSDDLRILQIPSNVGGTVPISQLARLVYTSSLSGINRINQEKEVEVTYTFEDDITGSKQLLDDARASIDDVIDDIIPPPGISIEVVHDELDLSEFYFLIFAAIVLIFMILASAFESLIQPLVMMFTIPLATVGAFWGLILTGNSIMNANALIGFIILLGVIVNNGIILIDYSRLLQKRNYRPTRALLMAGQARLRPILITTITSVLAMIPLAMGNTDYVAKIGAPFAITVIGGLSIGTLFTLLLIPTFSYGMHTALVWWHKLSLRIKLIQLVALIGASFMIYNGVDSTLWQFANLIAVFGIVPGITYFSMTSLRRASSKIIPETDPITIKIHNVVKFYDGFSRFVREWHKADRRNEHLQARGERLPGRKTIDQIWQLPLWLFHLYFAYIHAESGFWILIFAITAYIHTVLLGRFILGIFKSNDNHSIKSAKWYQRLLTLIVWIAPGANIGWWLFGHDAIASAIVFGTPWYLAVLIWRTSEILYRNKTDIMRLTGRFKRTRKLFYRMVKAIPIIGKKKIPFRALDQVSLEIGSGMFGLVGPNGAGKTTLMRVICGILEQSQGVVTVNGLDLNEYREEMQALIGYLPQEFGTYENMTAYQFLDYQAILKGITEPTKRKEIVERAIKSVHLGEKRNTKIKAFSGGMKQRVGIAQTLLHLPRILVVDEPTAGLDPRERIRFRNLLADLARDRVVIFSTHIIEDISSSCNRLAVLTDGKVRFLGTPVEMVKLTEGYVWQATVSEEFFETFRTKARVVHHMRDGDGIKLRVLSKEKPLEQAKAVTPSLEDSYLWLLDTMETRDDN